jgi:hypothetical protein
MTFFHLFIAQGKTKCVYLLKKTYGKILKFVNKPKTPDPDLRLEYGSGRQILRGSGSETLPSGAAGCGYWKTTINICKKVAP